MSLNREEYDFVCYVESQYFLHGSVPTKPIAARGFGVSEQRISTLLGKPSIIEALGERGIVLKGAEGKSSDGVLTGEQLAYVNAVLDPSDTRSRQKLLRDLGISSQRVNAWNRDPAFQSYMRDRAEGLFPNIVPEALTALTSNVIRGDMKAIQLALEMNGRWSSKTVGELNVEFLMQKILEILMIHLSDDPAKLTAIANDLGALSGVPALESNSTAVGGLHATNIQEIV